MQLTIDSSTPLMRCRNVFLRHGSIKRRATSCSVSKTQVCKLVPLLISWSMGLRDENDETEHSCEHINEIRYLFDDLEDSRAFGYGSDGR